MKSLKKIISGITALAMLSVSAVSASASEISGDLNDDSKVNIFDFILMKQYILGMSQLDEQGIINADMTEDGSVNIFDAVMMARQLVSSENTETDTPTAPVEDGSEITLLGDSIETSSSTVVIEGSSATITVPGTYIVTGTLNDGQIIVNVDKEIYPEGTVELSLEGVDISCSSNSPLYVASIGKECVITAKKGTDNVISDGEEYINADEDSGAIYSKDDLKFKGKGNLTVNGNCADGIVSKNDIKIFNGNITVNAVDDGIRGKDSVKIGDADDMAKEGAFDNLSVTVTAKNGDGIKSTETDDTSKGYVTINGGAVNIISYSDGIQAESALNVNGGTIDIYTYQGAEYTGSGSTSSSSQGGFGGMQDGNSNKMPDDLSAKGLKTSSGDITVNAGNITINSSDDCIHSSANINIYGGTFVLSSADDAIHADSDLTAGNQGGSLSDFSVYIPKCYEGLEGANVTQNAGTVIVNSSDDGYNAAGGADGSGSTSPGGWNQGGFGGSSGNNSITITGGLAFVNAQSGDHDGLDSNGTINISGGYVISNGQDPIDSDGSQTLNGKAIVTMTKGNGSIAQGEQVTVADGSGNVIVSFTASQAVSSISASCSENSNVSVYKGGTISGGTDIAPENSNQSIYVDGTISDGTSVTTSAGGSEGGFPTRPGMNAVARAARR